MTMTPDDVDAEFAAMTADLDISQPAEPDAQPSPFVVSVLGDIDVNVDAQIRTLLVREARRLSRSISDAEATALPAPGVDGDPTDDFADTAAASLADIRVERLAAFEETACNATITPAQAHQWIAATNDLRLHLRNRLDGAADYDCPEDAMLEQLACDLAGAVSHSLIAALSG
jgi:hypothetical protein